MRADKKKTEEIKKEKSFAREVFKETVIAAAIAGIILCFVGPTTVREHSMQPTVNDGDVLLSKGDYEISSEDMPGWLVATDGPLTLALDITVTDELKKEGTARELINRIQNLRKDSDFDVTDRVDVRIYADAPDYGEISSSLESFRDYVASQTLARNISVASLAEAGEAPEVEWNDSAVRIAVSRLS